MTKILIGLALSLSMMATTLPIYAKENKDSIYENELNEAILSGSGTENDPYIVDYEKAPNFHEYVINGLGVITIKIINSDENDKFFSHF